MFIVLSACPYSNLVFLLDHSGGELTEFATCKTDGILGYDTHAKVMSTLFNDYVSGYSPLSAEVGDEYYLPSTQMINDFFALGGVLES